MTTMTEIDPSEKVHARQQALQQHVLLLAPSFGCWRGYYQLPKNKTEVELDGEAVEKGKTTTPRSILLADQCPRDANGTPWKTRLRDIESKHKALIEKYSVLFPIRGVRIIPKSRGKEFFDTLIGPVDERGQPVLDPDRGDEDQSIAYQLAQAADEFCQDLPSIFRQIRDAHPQVWEAVQARVPQKYDQMRQKFYVDAVPVELAGSGAGVQLTTDDLADHQYIVQNACRRKVEEAIEEMISGPREELAGALADLQNLIARNGRVSERSFRPVRAAIAKIRLFDFVANEAMLEQITRLEQRLNITSAKSLDSVTAASNGFAAAISALRAEVTDAEGQAADMERFGGRELRSVDLD